MPDQAPCYFEHICAMPRDSCEACRSAGFHYVADHLYIKNSGIPKAYLPSPADPSVIIRAQTGEFALYCRNLTSKVDKGIGAYMWSPNTGNGKTTVGCNLLLKYLLVNLPRFTHTDIEYPVLYLNVVELLETLRRQINDPDEEFQHLWSVLFSTLAPKLLLLDDIGAEKPSEWVKERLYSLINFRSANALATLFTSNCSTNDIQKTLGPRNTSRIQGCGVVVEFHGTDKRRGN